MSRATKPSAETKCPIVEDKPLNKICAMNDKRLQVLEDTLLSEQMAAVFKSKNNSREKFAFPVLNVQPPGLENFIRPFIADKGWGDKIYAMQKWPKSVILLSNHCRALNQSGKMASSKRFQVIEQGDLAEQMIQIIKTGGRQENKKSVNSLYGERAALPAIPQQSEKGEKKVETPEEKPQREAWEYEIAMGWNNLIDTFFSKESVKPPQEYSIPAFFPTHQWIENMLTEMQWTEKMAEGAWSTMPVATRPLSWL